MPTALTSGVEHEKLAEIRHSPQPLPVNLPAIDADATRIDQLAAAVGVAWGCSFGALLWVCLGLLVWELV